MELNQDLDQVSGKVLLENWEERARSTAITQGIDWYRRFAKPVPFNEQDEDWVSFRQGGREYSPLQTEY
jgi:hypothetical protein